MNVAEDSSFEVGGLTEFTKATTCSSVAAGGNNGVICFGPMTNWFFVGDNNRNQTILVGITINKALADEG